MRVLIAGGFGYVGGRLGMHLASSGYDVVLGSRFPQPKPEWLTKGDVNVLDWRDKNSLLHACKNVEVVLQTAGLNAAECLKNPIKALEVNGRNTGRLVDAARTTGVKKFIYLSTAHVYAGKLTGLITEDSEINNNHPYATSHVAGENKVKFYSGDMQKVVVRLANSFGFPSGNNENCWNLVVNNLCKQAAVDRQMVIIGPSNALRNFISMTDVCLRLNRLISSKETLPDPLIFNMGDQTRSILDIAISIKYIYRDLMEIDLPIIEMTEKIVERNQKFSFKSSVMESLGFNWTSSYSEELKMLIEYSESTFREL